MFQTRVTNICKDIIEWEVTFSSRGADFKQLQETNFYILAMLQFPSHETLYQHSSHLHTFIKISQRTLNMLYLMSLISMLGSFPPVDPPSAFLASERRDLKRLEAVTKMILCA